MIVSHKHKFIFIKTRKTAGTSLEIALSKICGSDDIITPISDVDENVRLNSGGRSAQNCYVPITRYLRTDLRTLMVKGKRRRFINHMEAYRIKRYLGNKIWNSYYKFCFDRHPYDKAISMYYWELSLPQNKIMSFDEFLDSGSIQKAIASNLYCIGNEKVVDDVYKFEELNHSLDVLSDKLRLNKKLNMPTYKAKSTQRNKNATANLTLNDAQKEKINQIFWRDFLMSNYS